MKKSETKKQKLQLDGQIVRALQTQELREVVGGTLTSAPTGVSGPPRFCCA
jgi:hypothetical protein